VATLLTTHLLDPSRPADRARWAELRAPRDDHLLAERQLGEGCFECAEGPFSTYQRTVTAAAADGGLRVTERIDYDLAIPGWGVVFRVPIRRELRNPSPHSPWWAPPDRLDAPTTVALSALAGLTLIAGYLGTLITQTITFAADQFDASDREQGITLAAVRVGVLLALAIVAVADRRGRRSLIRVSAMASCAVTATGALAPGMVWLGVSQTIARGLATALALLIGIVAAEIVPRNSRAYTVSILALTGALGSGIAVWLLPLADLGVGAWRILYVVPLVGIPYARYFLRGLPESHRFVIAIERPPIRPHAARLWLLAVSAFLASMFVAPASQFLNDFLRDDLDYSAAQISAFTLITNTPGFLGILIGGHLADARGRRVVGAVAILGGTTFTVIMFLSQGWSLWAWSIAGSIVGAAAVPALGVYGPELFATTARGRANGFITLVGVLGSAAGLLIVGSLSDTWGSFGPAVAVVAAGPLLLTLLILAAYPETAHRALEEINPEDASP
jgi:MFS family permease